MDDTDAVLNPNFIVISARLQPNAASTVPPGSRHNTEIIMANTK